MKQRNASLLAVVLFLIGLGGCQQPLTSIPLFNPSASLKNRIGSAYEVYGEVNGQIAEFRAKGWMTQEDVDRSWSPSLDKARRLIDDANQLRLEGDEAGGKAKIEDVRALLKSLRDGLALLEKSKKT